ncbi:MAG TPA: hypothetical protein VMF58_09665 [Rhizomicrobium sp.]|nr:hypothetical protein [Rhizomicrobium sp.]
MRRHILFSVPVAAGLILGNVTGSAHVEGAPSTGAAIDVPNAEMKAIFDADQNDRTGKPIDWSVVAPKDDRRRARTRQLLADGALKTAEDYWEAAFVFQHGEATDDFLEAHVLAKVAVAKGKQDALWISAATLDRYLMRIGQKQVLGTQYNRPENGKPWTQEPYDRALISDALRRELGVETQAVQADNLKRMQDGK